MMKNSKDNPKPAKPRDKPKPDDPQKALEAVEAKIYKTLDKLNSLNDQACLLRRQITEPKSPIIRMLSPHKDIMFLIFRHTHSFKDPGKPGNATFPLRLGSICAAWRSIAWECPMLWAELHVELIRPKRSILEPSRRLELLKEWLSRTNHLPLTIRIWEFDNYSGAHDIWSIFKFFLSYRKRWSVLDVIIPREQFLFFPANTEFPLLKQVKFQDSREGPRDTPPTMPLQHAPNLEKLAISYCSDFATLDLSWERLKELEIGHTYLEGCLILLQRTPHLRGLCINRPHRGYSDKQSTILAESLVLLALEKFKITVVTYEDGCRLDSYSHVTHFFDSITLPKVSEIEISCQVEPGQPFTADSFCNLLQRSGSRTLVRLSLDKVILDESDLIRILEHTPGVVDLALHHVMHAITDSGPAIESKFWEHLCRSAGKRADFLPRLERFLYHGPLTFSWDSLRSILTSRIDTSLTIASGAARTQDQDVGTTLKYVKLIINSPTSTLIDIPPDVREEVARAFSCGCTVKLEHTEGGDSMT